jgi:hypothetical protein
MGLVTFKHGPAPDDRKLADREDRTDMEYDALLERGL